MKKRKSGLAPERFASWLCTNEHADPKYGHIYRYHSRSDRHSIALCQFVVEDLLERSPELRRDAEAGRVAYGINVLFEFPSGKKKTLDLVLGRPADGARGLMPGISKTAQFADLYVSCEAKSVMTEHGKSQPRVFDELSSSHEIVHQGGQNVIAAGLTVVNIAETFVSPLRQKSLDSLHVTRHKQPHVAQKMIEHLRGLPIREGVSGVGFDAYATIVVDCDNQGPSTLWTAAPAPQPGDRDHYETFLARILKFYTERFAS